MSHFNTYELDNGGIYSGDLNCAGLPETLDGSAIWCDGRRYVGQWVNGKISGMGTMMYPNGKTVYGCWLNGELIHEFKPRSSNLPMSHTDSPCQKITALLVGNCQYGDEHNLNNAIEDTKAIECKLRRMGIDVTRIENGTKDDINNALAQLCSKSNYYDHAFFFFSGHGCTYQGSHFLQTVPDDTSESDFIRLESISDLLRDANFTNRIIIEDACNTIISDRGPADVFIKNKSTEELGGTLMAFATGLGDESSDGICGQHSPYAFALLEYLDQPNMSLLEMFNQVYKYVVAYSVKVLHRPQEPWVYFQNISPTFTLFPL